MAALDIECLLVLNDSEPGTTAILKNNVEPILAAIQAEASRLHLQTIYFEKGAVALCVGIRCGAISSDMMVSSQAARSIG
ncbi:MAG: hypothetical protein AB7S93_00630 [Xanthobacteraceae bacterium]